MTRLNGGFFFVVALIPLELLIRQHLRANLRACRKGKWLRTLPDHALSLECRAMKLS
jgi:hypothetical protein